LPAGRALYGVHAAEAALRNPKRVVGKVYLSANAGPQFRDLAAQRKVAVIEAAPHDLDALSGAGVHQGIVLLVEPLPQPHLTDVLAEIGGEATCRFAMLDQVTDPHNVGAVLRSAAAFGIAGVIVQSRHSPPQSATLAKAASGALEYVPLIETVNLSRALDELRDHGFACVGFDSDADSTLSAESLAVPRITLVFGAEDKGLRRLVRERCDTVLSIAANGPIRSLNISNAAAIAFHAAAVQAG
jgi:23S rRNA (guanosine2251-2'-O)-methyltransferase